MTKARAPLTFELALTRIAAVITWARAAEIVGFKERTLRNWSEPNTSARISLEAALHLDVAFRAAGGEGAPLLQVYATRLEAEAAQACADLAALNQQIARAAKEGGEAIAFAIAAAQPGASPAELSRAEIELEEAVAAHTNALATLRAGRRGEALSSGEGN